MQDGVAALLQRLRREGAQLSRNRNFELFEGPLERRAQRLHLRLLQLEAELRRYAREGEVHLIRGPERAVIEVVVPSLRFRRCVYLEPLELEVLLEDPQTAALLRLPTLPDGEATR